jgi:hypothetical protein
MARRPPRQWLLIGVACGLVAVVLVRGAVLLVLGSLKLLALVGGLALVWLFLRGPRDGVR